LLTLGALAGGADAHSARILIGSSTLIYEQKPLYPNVDNNAVISLKSDSAGPYYEVSDPGSTGIAYPPACIPLAGSEDDIRCPASGIDALYVRLGIGTSLRTTTDNITIDAPTPAVVSGGSVTNAGGPRTSNITVGPVGGNVIYGNPGPGVLNALNGFADTIHSCSGNVVEADLIDTVIADCAPPPEPPPVPEEPLPTPIPKGTPSPEPGTAPATTGTSTGGQTPQPVAGRTQTTPVELGYARLQSILRQRLVKFGVSVSTPMAVAARGSIALPEKGGTVKLTRARVRIGQAATAVAMRLYVPSRAVAKLRRAFLRHRRLYATVQVEATDPLSGIEYILSRRIALTR
jgi:hypothetical protein